MMLLMTRAGDSHDVGPGGDPGPETLIEAVTATRAVGSARVEMQTTLAGPAGPVTLVHRASFTDGGVRARAESDLSQVAAALEAAGQQLDGDWSQPTGIVVDGDTVFSQLGPMADALGRSPHDWASARLSTIAGAAAGDNDTFALALDPLGPLDLLVRPVVQIGRLADGEVRGVAARHLRADLDLTGGAANGAPTGSFEARLVAAGVDALPIDVWIGDDGVVRRLEIGLDAEGTQKTRFDVYDVGADVEVAVPDPAHVIDPDPSG
jgi:hypothetical protein